MNDIIELYMEGLTIEQIAEEVSYDMEFIIEYLKMQKKKDVNGKDYSHDFKEMVVERVLTGVKKGDIVKELGIAYRTINKYLEEFNVDAPKSIKKQEEQMYKEVDWHNFSVCPECKGVHVNDLNYMREEGQRNSYCLDCGTEWLERGEDDKVYKVLWEFVR